MFCSDGGGYDNDDNGEVDDDKEEEYSGHRVGTHVEVG